MKSVFYTVEELSDRIMNDRNSWIPEEFTIGKNLVYSSPATLAYNSPGAEGYGVKRTALCVPESVELIISPGCCGRNTSDISSMRGYEDRFYYLIMDEADLVTGRHLKRIPEAVKRIISDRLEKGLPVPKVVMLVTTCVDALLGTDMEHVAGVCERECSVRVRPAYMYALTRDGVKPPMVQVRESIFSLLDKKKKNPRRVNLLGYPAGLNNGAETELATILSSTGVTAMRSISDCHTYDDFMQMAGANFNIVLDPEARAAASYMEKNLNIGSVELQRFYGMDRISSQYRAFFSAFDMNPDASDNWHEWARDSVESWMNHIDMFSEKPVFAIGECVNANALELALSLIEYGYEVREVFATLSESDAYYVMEIAEKSPDTRIYFNQHPSMVGFECDHDISFCLGKDAAWYYRNADVASLSWNQDVQPFGYHGVSDLMSQIAWEWGHYQLGDTQGTEEDISRIVIDSSWDDDGETEHVSDIWTEHLLRVIGVGGRGEIKAASQVKKFIPLTRKKVRGYRRVLTPFAPDQSGAESVVFPMNSLTVILDAGGCTGNICGFDEPRWEKNSAMIFSAGLRDMDAVFGRDRELVAKIAKACDELEPDFITIIGTPVPSTIGTDYAGLRKDIEKRTGLKVVYVPTNGMNLYDVGVQQAYRALTDTFSDTHSIHPITGVWGLDFLDYSNMEMYEIVKKMMADGIDEAFVYGVNTFADAYAGKCENNMAFSVAGYEMAGGKTAPPEYIVSDHIARQAIMESEKPGTVLIVGEQIYSDAVRTIIRRRYPDKHIIVADFFTMIQSLMEDGDVHLKEEDDLTDLVDALSPSLIIGDPVLDGMLPEYKGRWIWRTHFATSGSREIQR